MARHAHALGRPLVIASLAAMLAISGCGARGDSAGDSESTDAITESNNFSEPLAFKVSPLNCEVENVNNWVYESMQDYYLFYQQVDRNVNTANYASPEELIRDLRVAPNDTFSYVADETAYSAFFNEGETFGFGWNFARSPDNSLYFSLIEPNSPLATAGVQRGDELVAINGITIPAFDQLSSSERRVIIGAADEVTTLDLSIDREGTPQRQVSVTSETYALQTVLNTDIIERNGVKVGYLHFYQFINTSSQELQQAFATFQAADISELVIDLRFNGGGRIFVANEMASHMVGSSNANKVFTTFSYNDKYRDQNASLYFENMQSTLALDRVFVLQSSNTCSASELVINSLRPFMEVITVGSTSCGKPYATSPNIACGKVINALEIELLNADGAGGYFGGIAADCPAIEDVRQPLGEPSEPLLAAALNYVDTGSCNLLAQRARVQSHTLNSEFKAVWRGGNSL